MTHGLYLKSALLSLLMTNALWAKKQVLSLDDEKVLHAFASKEGLTRLSIQGDRIKDVMGMDENINIEKDEQNGTLFLKGLTTKQSISILTENGLFQEMEINPSKEATSQIILKDKQSVDHKDIITAPLNAVFSDQSFMQTNSHESNSSYQHRILSLVHRLYNGESTSFTSSLEKLPKVNNVRVLMTTSLECSDKCDGPSVQDISVIQGRLIGHVLDVKNISDTPLILHETDFYQKGFIGISLKKHHLKAGETTKLFVVVKG